MDKELKKALEFSNYIQTLENQKNIIREKFLQSLTVYEGNSSITIDSTIISYLHSLINSGYTSAVILDDSEMPVKISDLDQFYQTVSKKYQDALDRYEEQYTKLLQQTSIENMVGLND